MAVAALMKTIYCHAIVYFTLFGVLLLGSGIWLWGLKAGFTVEQLQQYYCGNDLLFMQAKSTQGVLEVALPHALGMGLFMMVTAHFMLFVPQRHRRQIIRLIAVWLVSALVSITAPFGIVYGWSGLTEAKLVALVVFQILGFYLLWRVFQAAFTDRRESF